MATFLLSFVLAAVAAPMASNSLLALAEEKLEGKVVSAGDGKLVIVDDDGDNEEFEVSSKTKITRNEKPADLDDLQEGDVVKVTAQRSGVKYVALKIEARAPE
jgi:Domain of unknown function (DUF5666)